MEENQNNRKQIQAKEKRKEERRAVKEPTGSNEKKDSD